MWVGHGSEGGKGMGASDIVLDELERDALTELVNIGVSRAAVSLRKMVGAQVLLTVPSIDVVTRARAVMLIGQREPGALIAVRQDFDGAFSGSALLIFPEDNSLILVRAVAGDDLSKPELDAIEDEALAETGNIVLNGCLASMSNMLEQRLDFSLPLVVRGDGTVLFSGPEGDGTGVVLFLYINFTIDQREVRGYIAMLMDLPSVEALRLLIVAFIQRSLGTDKT
jgi:chemotaxis protein CheC